MGKVKKNRGSWKWAARNLAGAFALPILFTGCLKDRSLLKILSGNPATELVNSVPDGARDRHPVGSTGPAPVGPSQRLITILSTNDIHGGVEPTLTKSGIRQGGMAPWAGIVTAIRKGLNQRYGHSAGLLVVDAGDQFQGTLVSNVNEGRLVFDTMEKIGYDAVVAGNHDYDFGPVGWLEDQVSERTPVADRDPRGALSKIMGRVSFPLLSANTYVQSSLVDAHGKTVAVQPVNCAAAGAKAGAPAAPGIEWSQAKRFLKPYLIKSVAGVRVAMIGLDNAFTSQMTTAANVSDLCFRNEEDAYRDVRRELEGQADVFVIVIHGGDVGNDKKTSEMIARLGRSVDAVVAGHTHTTNDLWVGEVPLVQSMSGGQAFGRIDLVYDVNERKLVSGLARKVAAVPILEGICPASAKDFCQMDALTGRARYEGVEAEPDAAVQALIDAERAAVAPLAGKVLGRSEAALKPDRIAESGLANVLADALRSVAGTELAMMNTGGIRAPLPEGELTYQKFYEILPFNNRAVKIAPMTVAVLEELLLRSIQTCGQYGALMQSGLKVDFARNCEGRAGGLDPQAHLVRVVTVGDELLFDADLGGWMVPKDRSFTAVTLDFLASGGAGYDALGKVPFVADLGIHRELIVEFFAARQPVFKAGVDNRWRAFPRQ